MANLEAKVQIEKVLEYACGTCLKKFYAVDGSCPHCAAQQSVQLTALRRGLAVSFFINVVLLAVALYAIGGN